LWLQSIHKLRLMNVDFGSVVKDCGGARSAWAEVFGYASILAGWGWFWTLACY
jgi:hypothetical protein